MGARQNDKAMPMPKKSIDFEALRIIALKMPGMEASTSWGAQSLKLHGKLFVCQAMDKSAEPGSVMVRVGFAERERLIAQDPATYYMADHYKPHPFVLVRLSRMSGAALRSLLDAAWQSESTAASPRRRRSGAAAKSRAKRS